MLQSFAGVAAQTSSDAQRLANLGARDVATVGNLKFDIVIPEAARSLGREFRARVSEGRPIWVAGSTREGEEALIFDALAGAAARALPANTVTFIVPRHPQRFEPVAQLLRSRGIAFVRRSGNARVSPDTRVMLGDPLAREQMRAAADAFCAAHRGAADRLWAWLAPRLPP